MGMGGGLMKYLAAMGPKGEELMAMLAKGGDKIGRGAYEMGASSPKLTSAIGGAAAGYGASEMMDDDDDDDIVNLDALEKKTHQLSPLLQRYLGR